MLSSIAGICPDWTAKRQDCCAQPGNECGLSWNSRSDTQTCDQIAAILRETPCRLFPAGDTYLPPLGPLHTFPDRAPSYEHANKASVSYASDHPGYTRAVLGLVVSKQGTHEEANCEEFDVEIVEHVVQMLESLNALQ